MIIELSRERYISLLKITFMGQYVANSSREDGLPEYDEVEQHIISYAELIEVDDVLLYDEDLRAWFPPKEMELDIHAMSDEYEEDYFAEELVDQLAWTDVVKKYGDKFYAMSMEEKIRTEVPFLEKCYDELGENGLDNIGISK